MSSAELKELLGTLVGTPAKIRGLLDHLSDQQLRRRSSEGEFSCLETVCHLRDIEAEGYAPRINRILEEDQPMLADVDGARLAAERDYNSQDVNDALGIFSTAREGNVR